MASLDWKVFEAALPEMLIMLPQPAVKAHRPGVGFIIAHQGRGWHYFLLHWWNQENELCQKIFVRRFGPGERWRPAGEESFCIWDLEVLWFEREAYIAHVLSRPASPDIEGYLQKHLKVN